VQVEDRVKGTLTDPRRNIPGPSGAAHLGQGVSASPTPAPPPPSIPAADSGLLTWIPRVNLGRDRELVDAAMPAWQSAPGGPTDGVYVIWVGVIGDGRVAVLQGVQPDATRAVAQVSDRGHPPSIVVERVDPLPFPPDDVHALAVSYDGNTGLPNLAPGPGAQLLSLVLEPQLAAAPSPWRPSAAASSCVTAACPEPGCNSTALPSMVG
jgi:hypothetical protein